MNIWLKWSLLILANTLVSAGLLFNIVYDSPSLPVGLGMLAVSLVFVVLCVGLDGYLAQRNPAFRQAFTWAAIIKALISLTLVSEMLIGMLALTVAGVFFESGLSGDHLSDSTLFWLGCTLFLVGGMVTLALIFILASIIYGIKRLRVC